MNIPFYIQRKTAKSCTFLYNFCRNMSGLNIKSFVYTTCGCRVCMNCTVNMERFMNCLTCSLPYVEASVPELTKHKKNVKIDYI